jgi:hypothetical protein
VADGAALEALQADLQALGMQHKYRFVLGLEELQ